MNSGSTTAKPAAKPSAAEGVKLASNYLAGDIAKELVDGQSMFGKASTVLLKHHGTYQQDDRETRTVREGQKSAREYSFMVRCRIPGGKLTREQFLAQLDFGDQLANHTVRITTRQGIQFHGVLKGNLKELIKRINDVQLSTLAACGDVERNVMCCPAPHYQDPVHAELQDLADRLAHHLAPRTRAYHEIWLTDPDTGEESLVGGGPSPNGAAHGQVHHGNGHAGEDHVEPIYGPTYLPRKFKTAIGLPGDNCVDLYANDLGLMAICENYRVIGYNVLVGGGFGVTPSAAKTFPAVAKRMAFCSPDEVVDLATAVIKVQRDYGNRSDRKVARLKYLIANRGLDWFKEQVEQYFGHKLADPHPDDVHGFDDHLGWHEQGDGRLFYGLNIENGRVLDREGFRLKSALRAVLTRFGPNVRLTSHQSLLFTNLDPRHRDDLEATLREHGVPLSEEISAVRRWSMACVAWPTCGLAITESERVLPGVIDTFEQELARLGLSQEVFTVRMTGCPNGCARPYNSDIGLVGKAQGKYTILLGGRLIGDRLNTIYKDLVPLDEIVSTLSPVLSYFKHERLEGETLGDFCHRKGVADLAAWSERFVGQNAG
ncbi:MAG: NADPH-dependent assimilatory sulfite reductase hemoprotein subunit [Pirellulales bacterium]|nr:NADPH-dependent assimilatory sulfite reductase hemoprotein subunit [Pirellulales bacterium]